MAQLASDKSSLENENRLLKAIVLQSAVGFQDVVTGKRKRDDEVGGQ